MSTSRVVSAIMVPNTDATIVTVHTPADPLMAELGMTGYAKERYTVVRHGGEGALIEGVAMCDDLIAAQHAAQALYDCAVLDAHELAHRAP